MFDNEAPEFFVALDGPLEHGGDAAFDPPGVGEPEHSTPDAVAKARGFGFLKALRRSRVWKPFSPLIPQRIRSAGVRMAETAVDIDTVDNNEAIDFLRPIQQDQTRELSEILARPFLRWDVLWGENNV